MPENYRSTFILIAIESVTNSTQTMAPYIFSTSFFPYFSRRSVSKIRNSWSLLVCAPIWAVCQLLILVTLAVTIARATVHITTHLDEFEKVPHRSIWKYPHTNSTVKSLSSARSIKLYEQSENVNPFFV